MLREFMRKPFLGSNRAKDRAGLAYKGGFLALCMFVFTVPWEDLALVPGAGTVSRLVGLAAAPIALLGILEARRAKGHPFLWFSMLFVAWSLATYFWSISPGDTLSKGLNLLELWIAAWLIFQYSQSVQEVRVLLGAYALGSIVTSVSLLQGFFGGEVFSYSGYSAGQFNPNVLAAYLALATTVGCYLGKDAGQSVWVRALFWAISGLSALVVILTASRSGAIVLGVGLAYAIALLRRTSVTGRLLAISALGVALWMAIEITPLHIFERLATIPSELNGGTLDLRTVVWRAGLAVLPEHLLLGTGASTFPLTVAHVIGWQIAPHNVFIEVAVEAGLLGFALWCAALISSSAWLLRRKVDPDGMFWITVLTQLALILATANFEWRKAVWIFLALSAAAGSLMARRRRLTPRVCEVPMASGVSPSAVEL